MIPDLGGQRSEKPKSVLVLGPARSGTTWVTNTIAQGPNVSVVGEPDNWTRSYVCLSLDGTGTYPGPMSINDNYWSLWDSAFGKESSKLNSIAGVYKLWRLSDKLRPTLAHERIVNGYPTFVDKCWATLARPLQPNFARPAYSDNTVLVKSVYACRIAADIQKRYNTNVVIVRRGIYDGAASWVRLGYRRDAWLETTDTYQNLLAKYSLHPPAGNDPHDVSGVAWTYGILDLIHQELEQENKEWIPLKHESLCRDVSGSFKKLFKQLGLEFTDSVVAWLDGQNKPSSEDYGTARVSIDEPEKWKINLNEIQKSKLTEVLEQFESTVLK